MRSLPLLIAALTLRASTSFAAEGQVPRVVVVDSASSASTKGKNDLRAAIVSAVERASLELVPQSRALDKSTARCTFPECLERIEKNSRATHALRVDAKFGREKFKVSMELWDVAARRLVVTDSSECLICDEREFVETAGSRAATLLDRAFHQTAPPPAPPANAVEAPAVSPSPSPTAELQAVPAAAPLASDVGTTWRPGRLAFGLAAITAGTVSAIAGIHLLRTDGKDSCKAGERPPCDFQRDTKTAGAAWLVGGVATALVGGGLIWWARPTGNMQLSLSPWGATVTGRF